MDIIKRIGELKIVPVVALDNAKDAIPLANALLRSKLPILEITFRTEAAELSIAKITETFPEITVGAGTITTIDQAEKAKRSGAKFIVTPGFSRVITQYAIDRDIPIFPGVCTPTELMMLIEYNLTIAKFFPASQYGGLNAIKALSGPFPQMRFMPTGGIGPDNIKEYLLNPKVIACGGSWMVSNTLINEGRFYEIERITKEAVELVK